MEQRAHQDLMFFWLGNAVAVTVWLALSLTGVLTEGVGAIAFVLLASACYALLFVLPAWLLSWLAALLSARLAAVLAVLLAALLFFVLYVDARLFALYGFHFNGFVWNLLTTPGGIASLDSSDSASLTLALKFGLVVLAEALWLVAGNRLARRRQGAGRWMRVVLPGWMVALLVCQLVFGFARLQAWQPAIATAQQIPFFIPTRVRTLGARVGVEVVRNDAHVTRGRLTYPLAPLTTVAQPWRPNIIWLVSESLRADMLTPEIMPNLWKFSQQAWRFDNHYSGGNGTRQGVFSMFYGLPGNYWPAFLDAQQEPVLMTLLRERGYRFGLYTSSDFTYPEFNRTVFARFSDAELHVYNQQASWQNDIHNTTELLSFIDTARQGKAPWFAFLFFNSPHARYQFPDYVVIRPDYLKDFNYARADEASFRRDIKGILNRYINSVHLLDMELGRIFDYVAANHLQQDTLILVTGDHAEEFMDEGRWGHNSELHNAQIHTPLVLWIPGHGKGVSTAPTSHLDIVATLLPLLGVTTPIADYSEGADLFQPPAERYRLAASWDKVAAIGAHYKIILPVNETGLSGPEFLLADDSRPVDPAALGRELQPEVARILAEVSRFYGKGQPVTVGQRSGSTIAAKPR